MLPTQTAAADYEQCCKLYMLGILYTAIGGQADAYRVQKAVNFKRGGWFKTGLPWKGNHPALPNNKVGCLKQVENMFENWRIRVFLSSMMLSSKGNLLREL